MSEESNLGQGGLRRWVRLCSKLEGSPSGPSSFGANPKSPLRHDAVLIGPANAGDNLLAYHMLVEGIAVSGDSVFKPKILDRVFTGEALSEYLNARKWHMMPERGYTGLSDLQIRALATAVRLAKPIYHFVKNNCQHFIGAVIDGLKKNKGILAASVSLEPDEDEVQDAEPEDGLGMLLQANVDAANKYLKSSPEVPDYEDLLNQWVQSLYGEMATQDVPIVKED